MVLLTQHLLKLKILTHPAQLIAADADCNGQVDSLDFAVLRKLFIPIDTVLCRAWTLIDAAAMLPDNPLQAPLPTSITLYNYDGNSQAIDFLAIKTGNLNVNFPTSQTSSTTSAPGVFSAAPQPNPTHGAVWFGVQLPEPTDLLLEIFDTGGRLLFARQQPGQAGAQQVELPAEALPGPGIYFWRVSVAGQVVSGKLVRM